jgi:hypothetical protein
VRTKSSVLTAITVRTSNPADWGVRREECGPKRYEVTGRWKILRNEELHNLYSSPNIIRMMVVHVARMDEKRYSHKNCARKIQTKEIIWKDSESVEG